MGRDDSDREKNPVKVRLRERVLAPEVGMQNYITTYRGLIAADTIDDYVDVVFNRAAGSEVWDETGKKYYDFNAAVGTMALGHGVTEINDALHKQGATLDHLEGSAHHYRFTVSAGGKKYTISPATLAEELLPLMFPGLPPEKETRLTFDISGSTGVNVALKLMWKARPERPQFLTFEKGFHGRHGWSLDATNSKPKTQKRGYPIQSLVPARLPFPMTRDDLNRALEMLSHLSLQDIGGFLFEYSQGEGGMRWAPTPLMSELLYTCQTLGLILIDDEVQTGLGRTGEWYAWQHGTVVPDIIITSKALGGRVPMAAIGFKRSIYNYKDQEVLHPGWHSGTFPKYPTGVTSAIVTLALMKKRGVVENARTMSLHLTDALAASTARTAGHPYVCRTGFGLLQGLRFLRADGSPFPKWRDEVLKRLLHAEPVGIITNGAGDSVVRFEPPLVIPKTAIDYLGAVLEKVIPESLREVSSAKK